MADAPGSEEVARAPLAELERQVERGSMFTQAVFQKSFTRLSTLEAVVWELVETLVDKEVVAVAELPGAVAARVELEARSDAAEPSTLPWPAVAIRVDPEEPKISEPVDCAARISICQGVCCRLKFALTQEEVERGRVKWDIGHPYVIRQDSDGYCTHNDAGSHGCSIYAERPRLCRDYSCQGDARIWTDFDAMVLNQAWIDEHLGQGDAILLVDSEPSPEPAPAVSPAASPAVSPSGP
jgi:Putative zinc- or iron-chelating domain